MYSQTSSMQKYIVQCYITLQYDDRRRYYLLHTHISQYSSTYLSPILVLPIRSFLRRSQSEVRLCRIIVQFCIKCMVSREESYVSLVRYNNAPFYKILSRLMKVRGNIICLNTSFSVMKYHFEPLKMKPQKRKHKMISFFIFRQLGNKIRYKKNEISIIYA